jgi:DNA repair protein RadC
MPTDWMIRDLPQGERPRERLLDQGSGSLSDAELVAVLLRTGHVGSSAVEVAMELLNENGGLPGLLSATAQSLQRRGIGPAKAAGLLAALEIARRLARQSLDRERQPLSRPDEMARYLNLRYRVRDQEVMGALFLDNRGRLLGERELYRGTLDRAAVEPREILKECLLRGAGAVVIFHNHPSGDPSPSVDDIEFTRNMAAAARIMGIRLADHLILGERGTWASVRDQIAW